MNTKKKMMMIENGFISRGFVVSSCTISLSLKNEMKWNKHAQIFELQTTFHTHTHACFSLINFSLSFVCVCLLYTIKSITNLIIIIIIKRLSNCSSFPIYYIPGTHTHNTTILFWLNQCWWISCSLCVVFCRCYLLFLDVFVWCTHSNEKNLQVHKVHNGEIFFFWIRSNPRTIIPIIIVVHSPLGQTWIKLLLLSLLCLHLHRHRHNTHLLV